MTHLPRIVLCLAILSLASFVRADDQDSQSQQAPEEIPDFNHLDDYIYVPKTTLNLGFRFLFTGPKTSFSGQGVIPSLENPGDSTVANVSHTYHDGAVNPDARQISVGDGNGGTSIVTVPSDGKTNSWGYNNASQITSDGNLNMHTYSAAINDSAFHSKNGDSSAGVELIASREMGNLGKHLQWNLTAGFSVTDIRSALSDHAPAIVTTRTDTYDLFGQIPPAPPFVSPSTSNQNVLNSSGAVVTSGVPTTTTTTINGVTTTTTVATNATQNVDQTVLLGNQPLPGSPNTALSSTTIINQYSIEGAYYTLRAGPTVIWPISTHLRLNLSVGLALIYSGTDYSVEEYFTPETGAPETEIFRKSNAHMLPGYYADLSLQYQLTDTTGFYVGALYQGAGSYNQSVGTGDTIAGEPQLAASDASYTTRIDFSNQSGLRAGMSVKF